MIKIFKIMSKTLSGVRAEIFTANYHYTTITTA